MKRLLSIIILLQIAGMASNLYSQSLKERAHSDLASLRKRADENMSDLRKRANDNFIKLLGQKWKQDEKPTPAVVPSKPQQEEPPLPIAPKQDEPEPLKDNPVPVKVVEQPVEPSPAPAPIAPIAPVHPKKTADFHIEFFGTPLDFKFNATSCYFGVLQTPQDIAAAWQSMVNENFDNLLAGMLNVRKELDLCDWAYYLLAQQIAETVYHGPSNGSAMLTYYLMCQSGFDATVVRTVSDNRLYCCVASDYCIFYRPSFDMEGVKYYFLNSTEITGYFDLFPHKFPMANKLRLPMLQKNAFLAAPVNSKTFEVNDPKPFGASVMVNRNSIDFYKTYPRSTYGNDFGTQWLFYAQAPLSETARTSLYPSLKTALSGKSEYEKVATLLSFMHKSFDYKKDDEVWGSDRAFFPEECLYYPYQDCEDRAILLSRFVRDLVGLDCILVYYPGHIAMAVHFNEDVKGDHITVNGRKFVIADPCYINAAIGQSMYTTAEKVVILPR